MKKVKAVLCCQGGFTLAELLVVVVLIAVVIAIPVQALYLTNRDWEFNQAMSAVLMDSNTFNTRLSREVRSAGSPQSGNAAVQLVSESGVQVLVLYVPSGTQWERVKYKLSSSTVQRGSFVGTASQVIDPNSTDTWTSVASGVSSLTFEVTDERMVKVTMQLSDTMNATPSFQTFQVASTYLSRSKQADTGEDVSSSTSVFSVILDKYQLELEYNKSATLNAYVFPSTAANKSITWSKKNNNISITNATNTSAVITGTVKNSSDEVTVTTSDGGFTAKCYVAVGNPGC